MATTLGRKTLKLSKFNQFLPTILKSRQSNNSFGAGKAAIEIDLLYLDAVVNLEMLNES